ncbi:MAG TPA: DUF192 domain-containing protein [Usitatibacter sp.]|nr:DUF192 domain-containing protein [Usitatibacter sp.]
MMTQSQPFDRFLAWRFLSALVLSLLVAAASAEPAMRTTQLRIGKHTLRVEVAATDAQREKGLMFREKMGANDGMLFVFDEPAYHAMWMKNTPLPLSVAFVDREGVILNILDMEPHTLDAHASAGPSIYAIETNKGWFASRGIKAGERVTGLPRASR